MTVDTSTVVDAVIQFVATEWAPIPVGDGQAPTLAGVGEQGPSKTTYEEALRVGYIVAYEIDIDGGAGLPRGFSGGQGMQMVRVQFNVSGQHAQQVRRITSAVQRSIVDKVDGDWVNDIPVAGHAILDRTLGLKIPIEPAGSGVHGGGSVDLLVQATV